MVTSSSDLEKYETEALRSIESQKGSQPNDEVYVIELTSIRFEKFTPSIKQLLERFSSLQMLTINDCGLNDLSNFPHLPSLIRLDLVFNSIKGEELQYLRGSRHLQTLMVGANNIQNVNDLRHLGQMKQLLQIDLLNNPVVKSKDYRDFIFDLFPSLHILDTLNRKGIDQSKANLDISASRIPQTLFDKSKPAPVQAITKAPVKAKLPTAAVASAPRPIAVPAQKKAAKARIQAKTTSSQTKSVTPIPTLVQGPRKVPSARKGKSDITFPSTSSRSISKRSGLIFPCGRIRRYLKTSCRESRISANSSVFLAGVLEYLTAEVLDLCQIKVKKDKMKRITPKYIRDVFREDFEFEKMLQGVIISDAGKI